MTNRAQGMGAVIVSVIVTLGFFGTLAGLLFGHVAPELHDVVVGLTGTLGAGFTGVISYWLGSSSGSRAKDAHIADLSRSNG